VSCFDTRSLVNVQYEDAVHFLQLAIVGLHMLDVHVPVRTYIIVTLMRVHMYVQLKVQLAALSTTGSGRIVYTRAVTPS